MSLAQHALFMVCVALASYVQNLTGFAFGLLLLGLVGLLELAPLADVTNVASVLTLVNAFALFKSARPQFDREVMAPTLIASLPGVLMGVVLLNWLSDNVMVVLQLLLGATIVCCALVLVLGAASATRRSRSATFAGFGLVSGILGGLFSTAGPPLVYHFYRQPMAMAAIRDALVAIFTVNALARIALMASLHRVTPDALWLSAEAAPIVLGLTCWMARRPSGWTPRAVKRVVCLLLLLVGLGLMVPAANTMQPAVRQQST